MSEEEEVPVDAGKRGAVSDRVVVDEVRIDRTDQVSYSRGHPVLGVEPHVRQASQDHSLKERHPEPVRPHQVKVSSGWSELKMVSDHDEMSAGGGKGGHQVTF